MSAPMDRAGVVRVMVEAYLNSPHFSIELVAPDILAAFEAAGLRVVPESVLHRLEELARLGNSERYGNSVGNVIAQAALRAASPFAPPPKETQE